MKLAMVADGEDYGKILRDISQYLTNTLNQKTDPQPMCLCDNPVFEFYRYKGVILHTHDKGCYNKLKDIIKAHPKTSFIIWATVEDRLDEAKEALPGLNNIEYLVAFDRSYYSYSHEEKVEMFSEEILKTIKDMRKLMRKSRRKAKH